MRKLSPRVVLSLTVFVIVFGLMAQAQKDDSSTENNITLAKLGVTEDQKTRIKALWETQTPSPHSGAQRSEDLEPISSGQSRLGR